MTEIKKPKVFTSIAQQEMDKASAQFEAFEQNVKEMTLDSMNKAPKAEQEAQTKLSSRQVQNANDVYLKPNRSISSREKFNEKFRDEYNFKKEYVQFIAENHEIIGETIELWTKCFPGQPAEEWKVPVNKPVWGPRYLAEQLKKCCYHRLMMDETPVTVERTGTVYGRMIAQETRQRLDARPVDTRKSVFMGSQAM